MKYTEKCGTVRQATDDNIVRRMRFACWINKAADTHSEYVIFIAYPREQKLRECVSSSRYAYIAYLVHITNSHIPRSNSFRIPSAGNTKLLLDMILALYLVQLQAGFSSLRRKFNYGSVNLEFLLRKVTVWTVSLFGFPVYVSRYRFSVPFSLT